MWVINNAVLLLGILLWSNNNNAGAFQPTPNSNKKKWSSVACHMSAQKEGSRRAFLAGVAAAVALPGMALADGTTTLHIVDYPKKGACGQANVPEAGVFFAKKLGSMVEGACAVDGYTVSQGTAPGIKEKDQKRTYEIYGKE